MTAPAPPGPASTFLCDHPPIVVIPQPHFLNTPLLESRSWPPPRRPSPRSALQREAQLKSAVGAARPNLVWLTGSVKEKRSETSSGGRIMKRGRRTQDWGADSGVETKKRGPVGKEEKLHHHPLLVSRKNTRWVVGAESKLSRNLNLLPCPSFPMVSLYFYFSLASRSLSKSNSHTENFFLRDALLKSLLPFRSSST